MNKKRGRPNSDKKILIVETGEVFSGYSEAATKVKGNRGCVYLCCHSPKGRKKHKGYTFRLL